MGNILDEFLEALDGVETIPSELKEMSAQESMELVEGVTQMFLGGKRKKEEWKWIYMYNTRYKISSHGRVKSHQRKKIKVLKHFTNKFGYQRVTLFKKGHKRHWMIHVLVAKHFVVNLDRDNFDQVDHENGLCDDNYFENLRWCTHAMNHKYRKEKNEINDKHKNKNR